MHKLIFKKVKEIQWTTVKKKIAKALGCSSIAVKITSPLRMQVSSIGTPETHLVVIEAVKGICSKIGYPIISERKCIREITERCYSKGKEEKSKSILPEHTSTLNFADNKSFAEKDVLTKLWNYLFPIEDLTSKEAVYGYVDNDFIGTRLKGRAVKALEEIYEVYKNNQ